jgi:hypothetical protein
LKNAENLFKFLFWVFLKNKITKLQKFTPLPAPHPKEKNNDPDIIICIVSGD